MTERSCLFGGIYCMYYKDGDGAIPENLKGLIRQMCPEKRLYVNDFDDPVERTVQGINAQTFKMADFLKSDIRELFEATVGGCGLFCVSYGDAIANYAVRTAPSHRFGLPPGHEEDCARARLK